MKYKIFSVFDTKSKLYSMPSYFKTSGEALRAFMEACKDRNSTVGKYPEDFVFFQLGEFDEEDGSFLCVDAPLSVARGVDFKE